MWNDRVCYSTQNRSEHIYFDLDIMSWEISAKLGYKCVYALLDQDVLNPALGSGVWAVSQRNNKCFKPDPKVKVFAETSKVKITFF